jgi:LysR family glycine cleavage system transcriptional activator
MRPIVQNVDRLQRLAVFESAARLGSFTAAATELRMSQPAVTRQVRELEHTLGIELFHRTANRSTLSEPGRRLADALDAGFSGIERTLSELNDPNPMFVLASPPGFAQQLLVPVLDELQDALPDHDIRLWLYDRDTDLDAGAYDAAIRLGTDYGDHFDAQVLFTERAVPIATPAFATEHRLNRSSSAAEVLLLPLLHMEADGRPWMSWAEWLKPFGLALTPGRRRILHNNYSTVLQQAVAGRGVALGWLGIVDQLLDDNVLTVVGPETCTARTYQVVWPARHRTPAVGAVIEWLLSRVGNTQN